MAAIETEARDEAMASARKEFNTTLLSLLAHDKRTLVHVNSDASIQLALDLLVKHNILSVPVLDEAENGDRVPKGIVSIFDILAYVVFCAFPEDASTPTVDQMAGSLAQPIADLIGVHDEGKKLWMYGPTSSLEEVTEAMSKGVHRVLALYEVDGGNHPIYRIVSQSDVVRHFLHYAQSYPDVHRSLEELGLASASGMPVVSIKPTDTALHGFRVMHQRDVQAVPVIGDDGSIVATLSVADLRGLCLANFKRLTSPVLDYLRAHRTEHVVSCSPSDTLLHTMMKSLAARMHRVWIVDADRRPLGTVTLSDMINVLRGLDEDLHSRQLAVYGRQAMRQLTVSNVLISGMNGLGAEITKNIILAGVRGVTLHDTANATTGDLGSQFYLREEDIGKNRAVACLKSMRELNPSVKVEAHDGELNEALISQHTVFVHIGGSEADSIRFDNFCRSRTPPIPYIKADVRGLYGALFTDFGDTFTVTDTNGEPPGSHIIASIDETGKFLIVNEDSINFGDGSWVTFTEISGIEELNDGVPRKVKDVHPFSFRLEDDSIDWSKYKTGGIVTQVKMNAELNFKPYGELVNDPGFLTDCDLSKFGRANLLHSIHRAIDAFQTKHGHLPEPRNRSHGDEVLATTRELNEKTSMPVEVVEEVVRAHASGASAVLSPMAAAYGGIVGQEVIKAVTGKFMPFFQFLYMDFAECLSDEELGDDEFKIEKPSRYDHQIQVFGKSFQERLMNQRYFLVGAGALGCEFLKNFAMVGLGCGSEGKVTVTDDDVIEKSNLSRQFLFRNWHIHKSKAEVAASVVKEMNPALNITPLVERVQPSTENIFNEEFWTSLTGVCNALDNIKARLYVDQQCIWYEKSLLESGTLGPKCHSQVVIPHKTAHYGAQRDPEDKNTPACTLHNFPHTIDHCLQWGKSEFVGHFEVAPVEFSKFYSEEDYVRQLKEAETGAPEILEKLRAVADCATYQTRTFQDCVAWARIKFEEYFHNRVATLVANFPEDARTKEGNLFWSPPKRFPTPLKFSADDAEHMRFIVAAANLRARVCGVSVDTKDNNNRNPAFFRPLLAKVEVPHFEVKEDNSLKKEIAAAESNGGASAAEASSSDDEIDAALKKCPPAEQVKGISMQAEDFEKDDDKNFHMDFVGAVGNLRARNYGIQEVDPLKAKLIAGRIIPAIATATTMATGLIMLELYKLVNNKQVGKDFATCGAYRNSSNNLAIAKIDFFDTSLPEKACDRVEKTTPNPDYPDYVEEEEIVAYPPGFTVWDKINVDINSATDTVGDLKKAFAEQHKLGLESIAFLTDGGKKLMLLYTSFVPAHKERLDKLFADVYKEVVEEPLPKGGYVLPQCTFVPLDRDADSVDIPTLVLRIK